MAASSPRVHYAVAPAFPIAYPPSHFPPRLLAVFARLGRVHVEVSATRASLGPLFRGTATCSKLFTRSGHVDRRIRAKLGLLTDTDISGLW